MDKIVTWFTSLDDVKEYLEAVEKYTDWVWAAGWEKPTELIPESNKYFSSQKEQWLAIRYCNNFLYDSVKFYWEWKEQINFKEAVLELKKQSMKTFEAGKTITELWINTTRKFVVVKSEGVFNEGDILELIMDDNTYSPQFRNQNWVESYKYLKNLAYYEEEMQEGDEVYVSDISEKRAIERKDKIILLRKCSDGYVCIESDYEEDYKKWGMFETEMWKYAVPVPKEQPIKEYTIEQLQEKLGEEFKIIK